MAYKYSQWTNFGLFSIGALLLDQLVKSQLSTEQMVLNVGISFGLFSGPILSLLIAIIWAGVALYLLKHAFAPIPTGLLIGGAASNLYDRFVYGGVRDVLAVPLLNLYNNVADWLIVIAIVWLLLIEVRRGKKND